VTTEDDFSAALDANPEDWQTRLVYADWLQERGDPRAEGYRALGARRLRPRPDKQETDVGRRFFTWFLRERQTSRKFHPNSLPGEWQALVEGGEQMSDAGEVIDPESTHPGAGEWIDFRTRREAEDAAARAFVKLSPERRAKLLTAAPAAGKPRKKPKPKKAARKKPAAQKPKAKKPKGKK
jgi:uncharacterized protein (TIGR02996 family)